VSEVRILVVEDDEVFAKYVCETLSNAGYKAQWVNNGQEALDIFSEDEHVYRVLFVDLMMPKIDGFQLIQKIRSNFKNVYPYIVVLSSLSNDEAIVRAINLGADDFLVKPVSQQKLISYVKSAFRKLQLITLDVLIELPVKMIELRDKHTSDHVRNVSLFSTLLARAYVEEGKAQELHDSFVEDLGIAALFHDVGKILIPESILQKPGLLTAEEYEIMKSHTTRGSEILKSALKTHPENHLLSVCYDVVRYHHEKWDGSGYPDGLKGEQIPLAARIVAIADVFDALTSDRHYRDAFSSEEALKIMQTEEKEHFDPDLFSVFLEYVRFFENIKKLRCTK